MPENLEPLAILCVGPCMVLLHNWTNIFSWCILHAVVKRMLPCEVGEGATAGRRFLCPFP